jgi:hypothetical protein
VAIAGKIAGGYLLCAGALADEERHGHGDGAARRGGPDLRRARAHRRVFDDATYAAMSW